MTGRHMLVIGGTGMLAGCCRLLAMRGDSVTVLGRRQTNVDRTVAQCASNRCEGASVDYRDERATVEVFEKIIKRRGRFDETICWIHEEQAPLAHIYFGRLTLSAFYHVLSSQAANPSNPGRLSNMTMTFNEQVPDVAHKTIILGFVPGLFGSRRLINEEISSGFFQSVEGGRAHSVVGQVEPWTSRP